MRTVMKFALVFASVVAMAFPVSANLGPEHGRLFAGVERITAAVTLEGEVPSLDGALVAGARPGDRADFVRQRAFDRPFFVRDFERPNPFIFRPRPFFFDREEAFENMFFDRDEFFGRERFFDRDEERER